MGERDAYLRGSLLALTPLLPSARRPQKLDSDTRSRFLTAPFLLSQLAVLYRNHAVPVSLLALYASLVLGIMATFSLPCSAQAAAAEPDTIPTAPQDSRQGLLLDWAGLQVVSVSFEGVNESLLTPLPSQLAQQAGTPLDPAKVRESLRSLYATGLYETIEVAGVRAGNNVSIIFTGNPRLFVGRVNVDGVKDDRLAAVLQSATQLQG